MRDTSFFVAPIRDHAFFEQTVFQRQVGHAFLQGTGFAAQVVHLAGGRSSGGIAGQTTLARFHELLRPGVIQALGDDFLAAQLGDTVFAAQPLQHDPDFVLCREVPARRTPYVLHHPLSWGLRRRFSQGGFGLHLRSFVTMTKPKSSLNHNLKSVPLALTADNVSRMVAVPHFPNACDKLRARAIACWVASHCSKQAATNGRECSSVDQRASYPRDKAS